MPIILPIIGATPGPSSSWSALFQDVIPDCPGLTTEVAAHYIRKACIDFCDRTWAYQLDISAVSVATQADYPVVIPAETELLAAPYVLYAATGGEFLELPPMALKVFQKRPTESGVPRNSVFQSPDVLTLFPTPDVSAEDILIRAVLRPTAGAQGFDSDLLRYRDAITYCAKSLLMSMNAKPWTNPGLAAQARGEYIRLCRDARIEASKQFTAVNLQVDMSMGVF